MKWRDGIDRLNRVQHSFRFKVIASIVVVVLAVSGLAAYLIERSAERTASQDTASIQPESDAVSNSADPAPPDGEAAADAQSPTDAAALAEFEAGVAMTQAAITKAIAEIQNRQADPTGLATGATVAVAVLLGVIWVGQGLTALAIITILGGVCAPMVLLGGDRTRGIGLFIAAVAALVFSFSVLIELLRLAFSGNGPIFGIARNVVNEAVRMKISLIFIVMLIFGLASLPGLLNDETPLRYRVQSFLQYGTGGSFWIIASLVLFLGVGTVAFEQRDRVIWQTMTKPVAAWQYLLGKWLGVSALAAALLAVSGSGVFLFTEYLRTQKAVGEVSPFVPANPASHLSEDRMVLENEILSARRSSKPVWPMLSEEFIRTEMEATFAKEREANADYEPSEEDVTSLRRQIIEAASVAYRTVPAAESNNPKRQLVFYGLKEARDRGGLITLKYKIDYGANDPGTEISASFLFENYPAPNRIEPIRQRIVPGQSLVLHLPTTVIREDGSLVCEVWNGDVMHRVFNPLTMSFPVDGLEVFYGVGSYRWTFACVMAVLWMKLAFLAMVAVTSATFLAFSVASLVSFGVFLIAESSAFLWKALEYYSAADREHGIIVYKVIVRAIALPISYVFRFYADLRPTTNLVEGRLIGITDFGYAVSLLAGLTITLYAIGIVVFRKRELATYSGQ